MKISIAAVLLCLSLSLPALADSDGAFCISEGYLAYELASWSSPEKKHVLKVVRVGEGIEDPVTLVLDDFQVHGMRCKSNEIEVLGWDKHYSISLSRHGVPTIKSVQPRNPGAPADFGVDSLEGKSRALIIPTKQGTQKYALRIVGSGANLVSDGGGMITHKAVSTLVQLDASNHVVRELKILTREWNETIH